MRSGWWEMTLPQLFSTRGPIAWTVAWLEVLDQAAPVAEGETSDTGDTDVLTPLVTELITREILFERASA